jgi:hypothetical protein
MDNLFDSYASYLKCNKSKLYEPIIIKSKNVLDKKDFAKFMVGTIKLLAMEHADYYLLESAYFEDLIDNSQILEELKLKVAIPEVYQKYGNKILDKILNKN